MNRLDFRWLQSRTNSCALAGVALRLRVVCDDPVDGGQQFQAVVTGETADSVENVGDTLLSFSVSSKELIQQWLDRTPAVPYRVASTSFSDGRSGGCSGTHRIERQCAF